MIAGRIKDVNDHSVNGAQNEPLRRRNRSGTLTGVLVSLIPGTGEISKRSLLGKIAARRPHASRRSAKMLTVRGEESRSRAASLYSWT